MGFLTPALLGGIALIAIPIALHLVMRRQPRMHTFPALRFVKARRESNRRRMQLRHWLLLAMRCLLIAILAAALARPTLKGAGLRGKEGAPLAIAMVLDNSLRMQYAHQNRTRLEAASEVADALVGKLPEESLVAVSDLGRAVSGFAPDLSAAASRVKNVRTLASSRPLPDAVVDAIQLVAEQSQRRQEVFVFTDLAQAAWPEQGRQAVADALAEHVDVRLYLVDCGVESPRNAALGELQPRRVVLRPGEPLRIEAPLSSNLGGDSALVELHLQRADGEPEKRGERIAELDAKGSARVAFEAADLPLGTHQGSVRLVAADPLMMDNTRYFTIEVRPPARVLLLAENADAALFVRQALDPTAEGGFSRFQCDVHSFAEADAAELDDYQAVLLLDPPDLNEATWNRLWEYAASGGGVGVFLGHNAVGRVDSFNSEAAARLMPGKLKRVSRAETYLRPRRLDHPALAGLKRYDEAIPWQACRVFRYWQFGDAPADAYVAAGMANDDPAIITRAAGRGRLIVVTTPFSDPLRPEGREPWNILPAQAWPFVALCDQLVGYLGQDADERLNYLAGETAQIVLPARDRAPNFVLRMPDGQAGSRISTTGDRELTVGVTEMLGNYRLTAGGQSQRLDRGFSVNAAAEFSDLARLDPEVLLATLPADRTQLIEAPDKVEQHVNIGRKGRELYAWAIALVVLVWSTEHVLANRFYGESRNGKG
jgi:hypothetical protein